MNIHTLFITAAAALLALPAQAEYRGFKASITKQISPANPGDNAIVELNTLIPMPHQLQFDSLTTPAGLNLKDAKTATMCPDGREANKCRQYFTFALDAQSSGKCNLTGNYLAKFNVSCIPGAAGGCTPGKHEVGFSLQSENFCTETNVSTAGFWTQVSGIHATDVGAGGDKYFVMWFLDATPNNTPRTPPNPTKAGFETVSLGYDKTAAMRRGGKAVRIDVDGAGNAFVVNAQGKMFRYANGGWQPVPGCLKDDGTKDVGICATDVGIGNNGTAWVIGTNAVPGGFGIYRWNSVRNDWDSMPGGAVRIDVDPQGNAWVVNNQGDIFRWTAKGWAVVHGKARDVGIGSKGAVFVAGADGVVYQWDEQSNKWNSRGGSQVTDITVNSDGAPVVINAAREVFVGQP